MRPIRAAGSPKGDRGIPDVDGPQDSGDKNKTSACLNPALQAWYTSEP